MQNTYVLTAALLTLVLGLVHSVAGEVMIFRNIIKDQLPPLAGSSTFTFRTLRAVWHTATVAFFGFMMFMLYFALPVEDIALVEFVQTVTVISFFSCALMMAIGTKGRHPGWIVLLMIAILAWLGKL